MTSTIYTAGYQGHTVEDLVRATGIGTSIIDIRLSPRSAIPGWGMWDLERAVRASRRGYFHFAEWGNRNFRGGPIDIFDFAAGLERGKLLLNCCAPVVLLCACRNYQTCHRKVIADLLRARGYESAELNWTGMEALL